mgnify:CR=1 FL=1
MARPETETPLAMAKPPPRMKRTDQASLELACLNSRIGLGRGSLELQVGASWGRMNNGKEGLRKLMKKIRS